MTNFARLTNILIELSGSSEKEIFNFLTQKEFIRPYHNEYIFETGTVFYPIDFSSIKLNLIILIPSQPITLRINGTSLIPISTIFILGQELNYRLSGTLEVQNNSGEQCLLKTYAYGD